MEQPSKITLKLAPDLVVSYRTHVIDGKVRPRQARSVYGVVVDPQERTVDMEATQALRVRLAERGAEPPR